jgi:hypothetical protein
MAYNSKVVPFPRALPLFAAAVILQQPHLILMDCHFSVGASAMTYDLRKGALP